MQPTSMDNLVSDARKAFVNELLQGNSSSSAPPLSRDDVHRLAKHVLKTVCVPTCRNIQLCKIHVIKTILPSPARTHSLAVFLIALVKQSAPVQNSTSSEGVDPDKAVWPEGSDPALRRVAVVLILHDILISLSRPDPLTAKWDSTTTSRDSSAELKSAVQLAVRLAAVRSSSVHLEEGLAADIAALVDVWRDLRIFEASELRTFSALVDSLPSREWSAALEEVRSIQERTASEGLSRTALPWSDRNQNLPEKHGVKGDPLAPWHELPAANGLMMKRQRGYPLRAAALPPGGYQLRGGGRPADRDLAKEVDWLISEVNFSYDKTTDASAVQDIDPLGNKVWKDPQRPTRNHYGWSLNGIAKRKELAKKFSSSAIGYHDVPFAIMYAPSPGGFPPDFEPVRSFSGPGGADVRGGRGGGWRGGRGNAPPWRGGRGNFRGHVTRYFS